MPTVPYSTPRIRQAPLATPDSRVRADAADFGAAQANAIGNLGQAVGKTADVADQFVRQQEQTSAMDATNNYLVEAGKAEVDFRSLNGTDVTPEAKDKYLQDVENAKLKYRDSLSGRSQTMFDQVVGRDMVSKKIDAEQHFVSQGKVAAEQTRASTIALSFGEAVGKAGTAQGEEAWKRGLATIASRPGATPEQTEADKIKFSSDLAESSIRAALESGDIPAAQSLFDKFTSSTLVDKTTEAALSKQLDRANQSKKDDQYVGALHAEAAKNTPSYDHIDLDQQEIAVDNQINTDLENGSITTEEADRRRNRSQSKFADEHRRMRVAQDVQGKAWSERILGAGGLEAAKGVVADAVANPETRWMEKALQQQAFNKYGSEAEKQAREERLALKDPVARFKSGEAIMAAINSKSFESAEQMTLAANALKLPQADIAKLQEAYNSQGTIKGLSQDDVLRAVTDPNAKKQYKDHPEDLYQLWRVVTDAWEPEKKVNDKDLHDAVAKYRWQGMLAKNETTVKVPDGAGGFRSVPVTLGSAVAAGRESEFRPSLDVNGLSLDAVQAEMRANGLEPNPRGPDKITHVPAKTDRVFQARNLFDLSKSNWENVTTPGYDVASPGDLTEENPDDAERDYVMSRYIGKDPGFSRVQEASQQRKVAEQRIAGLAAQSSKIAQAEVEASSYIDRAKYGEGVRGVEAVNREFEDSIAKEEVPAWLEKYSQAVHGVSLKRGAVNPTKFAPAGKQQWRVQAREAFLQAIQALR